jgi:Ser/Thr protein kinase RdoA (MazF antagonist)
MTIEVDSVPKKILDDALTLYPFGEMEHFEALSGATNKTFKVTTSITVIVLRFYNRSYSDLAHVEFEMQVLAYLERVGFPAPRVLAGTNGELIQKWDELLICACALIEGVPANSIPLTPAHLFSVGQRVATLQQTWATFESPFLPPIYLYLDMNRKAADMVGVHLRHRGLSVDPDALITQWEQASQRLRHRVDLLPMGMVHGDLWPPNVMIQGEEAVAILDFESCYYGPKVIDVALGLMEFSMFHGATMHEELAIAFLRGFFEAGGTLLPDEQAVMVDVMELGCAMWGTYEVIQSTPLIEGEAYLARLEKFRDPVSRKQFEEDLGRYISVARDMAEPSKDD